MSYQEKYKIKYLDSKNQFEQKAGSHLDIPQGTKSISKNEFIDRGLSSVIIPDSVTDIGIGAFFENKLTSVVIPDSVTSIGDAAFLKNKLTSLTIGNNVTSIGDGVFSDNNLTSVVIPESVTSIGRNVFSANKLTSVTIGNKITSINISTFYNNELTNIVIPDSVTSIGDGAFFENKLTSVTIPDLVTSIGKYSFLNNKLTSVVIPDSVTSIGELAFSNNKLTSVVIPDSVTSIGNFTFANNQLTSVVIPDSVTSIGKDAFSHNELTLKSVRIPIIFNTDEHKKRIFGDKYNLRNIIYTVKHLKIISGTISIDNKKYISMGLLSVEIPDSVTSIGIGAFQSNQLTSVTIPDSVTSIGNGAFYDNQLTSVTIGKKVTSISDNSFRNNKLESVTILESVTDIGFAAFARNQLTSVTIPDSVTSIGDHAFTQNQLTSVIMPDRFNTNEHRERIFGTNYIIRNIFFNKHLEISQGTTIINDSAYIKLQLTSVKIPYSVTSIGDLAFFRNEITNVEIPDSVTHIGDDAFTRNQLTSVTIGKKVTSIGDGAFNVNKLLSVIIPNSVTRIGESAFANNQLTSVTIGNSVTRIDDRAFNNNNLTSVTIPDNFNNDTEKARIFGSDFTKITFTLPTINSNIRLFPTVAPVVNLVEEHSIFDNIENELKNFGLNIQLGTISELRDQFKNLVDDPLNFATFKEGVVDASGSKTIELNRAYSDGTIERKIFTFKKHLSTGSFNTTDIYIDKNTPNNKEYIFRSSTSSSNEDQFKSFYENLKHIILYIIIRKRLGNIKFIPQPYHFGVKKDITTGQITLYMIMEKGKVTLEDYIEKTTLSADEIKKLVFSIYCDLYELSFLCMKEGDNSTLLKFKHNDFKCNNLVVTESGSPLIIDFGFSHFTITDAGRTIEFVSCSDRTKSIYYKSGPNGFNVIHDMLQLIASFNLITKRGFKPFEILKFTNNPGSNILDTNVIVYILSSLYGAQSVNSSELFRKFYSTFDLRTINTSRYTIEITPLELANNIGLTLADRIIDTFEKKYRKYKMKYLNLVAKLPKLGR